MLNMMACIAKFPVRSSPKNHDIKTTLHKSQTGLSTIINKKNRKGGRMTLSKFFPAPLSKMKCIKLNKNLSWK